MRMTVLFPRPMGRKEKSALACLLLGCLLVALAECQPLGDGQDGQAVSSGNALVGGNLTQVGTDLFPITFQREWGMKSGHLSCTVRGIEVLTNVNGLPEQGFETWPTVDVQDENGQWVILRYPEYIGEDGQLIPGLSLVLADVTVTSEGARSFTSRDGDGAGAVWGEFDDPCVFRADALFWLQELRDDLQTDCPLGYFSRREQRGEHRNAFRLEDGESMDFTLGFWMHDREQGGYVSSEDLYLVSSGQVLTRLDLSGEAVGQP